MIVFEVDYKPNWQPHRIPVLVFSNQLDFLWQANSTHFFSAPKFSGIGILLISLFLLFLLLLVSCPQTCLVGASHRTVDITERHLNSPPPLLQRQHPTDLCRWPFNIEARDTLGGRSRDEQTLFLCNAWPNPKIVFHSGML